MEGERELERYKTLIKTQDIRIYVNLTVIKVHISFRAIIRKYTLCVHLYSVACSYVFLK